MIHLILDIQRTFLFMEEFQGLYVAMSRCVVDSIGSSLKVQRRKKIFQDLSLTFTIKSRFSGIASATRCYEHILPNTAQHISDKELF